MLKLENITKVYNTKDTSVTALNGVSIDFRQNEFVAILGPSGCGKTTLLNIIGGLDHYTEGDLVIKGKSTKSYVDADWDAYRNHSIGFVFQNYNLIPHQTVLKNVELALTLSGVGKGERRKRAIDALTSVGLADQISKKPNQLSGGQMQRVAIARALVNNPSILLADEPTGALDTQTSIQVMDILKEIAKDRLVIMVTHNPDLANQYANRIIKLLDGKIVDDSNPYSYEIKEEEKVTNKKKKRDKNVSMSFFTALSLSLNNLLTKKARTFMVAFAGSIGIIGIALILSVSSGFQTYIDKVQEDTLSTYPLTVEKSNVDMSSLLENFMGNNKEVEHDLDKIYSNDVMVDMINTILQQTYTNDLKEFKKAVDSNKEIKQKMTAIKYSYGLTANIYASDTSEVFAVNPSKFLETLGVSQNAFMGNNLTQPFSEMLDNQELLDSQYDLLYGSWPTNYDEIVLVTNKNNEINDYILYTIGFKTQAEFRTLIASVLQGKPIPKTETSYTYEEILSYTFKLVLQCDYYQKDDDGKWNSILEDDEKLKEVINNGLTLKISGIVREKTSAAANSITTPFGYTKHLMEYIINETNKREIVLEQKSSPNIDVFSKEEFSETSLNSYDVNLQLLGSVDLDDPASISFYPVDFNAKKDLEQFISDYNANISDDKQIKYTDYISILLSSITKIVDVVSYVLIAFVAISLVVSSIMIGVITYISVLERIKEIGILRSIGASKKDIARVFNAETISIGFVSGLIGILITILLCIPINLIIKHFAEIGNIAKLPLLGGLILIVISVILNLIAGIIPAISASKKDPVEALRSE